MKDGGVAFYGKNSFLSNFHPSPINDSGRTFPTAEHLFQYKKAVFFQDVQTSVEILHARTPNKAKALSYKIKDFVRELWEPVAIQTLYKACALKFQQNPDLAEKLRLTKGRIVEANPKDTLFSCGLKLQDPNISEPAAWKGRNELGLILCKIRDTL